MPENKEIKIVDTLIEKFKDANGDQADLLLDAKWISDMRKTAVFVDDEILHPDKKNEKK